jgi:hypothetical protein
MKGKRKVKASRTVYKYSILHQTSLRALQAAKKNELGQFFNNLISMVFSAFCLEAYFNHLGETKFNIWGEKDRIRFEDKYKILAQKVNLQIDWNCRPYRTFKEIVDFRNKTAHARTEHVIEETEQILTEEEDPKLPESEWMELIKLEIATRFFDDMQEIISRLHHAAGYKRKPFGVPEIYDWWIGPLE